MIGAQPPRRHKRITAAVTIAFAVAYVVSCIAMLFPLAVSQ